MTTQTSTEVQDYLATNFPVHKFNQGETLTISQQDAPDYIEITINSIDRKHAALRLEITAVGSEISSYQRGEKFIAVPFQDRKNTWAAVKEEKGVLANQAVLLHTQDLNQIFFTISLSGSQEERILQAYDYADDDIDHEVMSELPDGDADFEAWVATRPTTDL